MEAIYTEETCITAFTKFFSDTDADSLGFLDTSSSADMTDIWGDDYAKSQFDMNGDGHLDISEIFFSNAADAPSFACVYDMSAGFSNCPPSAARRLTHDEDVACDDNEFEWTDSQGVLQVACCDGSEYLYCETSVNCGCVAVQ